MTAEEARDFCEDTECEDCPIVREKRPDWRTEYEKKVLHFPCFIGLADASVKQAYRTAYGRKT